MRDVDDVVVPTVCRPKPQNNNPLAAQITAANIEPWVDNAVAIIYLLLALAHQRCVSAGGHVYVLWARTHSRVKGKSFGRACLLCDRRPVGLR